MAITTEQLGSRRDQPGTTPSSPGGLSLNENVYTYHLREMDDQKAPRIRLLKLSPSSATDEIHIELLPKPVDLRHGTYEALSYVWGSEKDLVTVRFGSEGTNKFFVTRNLAEAFHYLRYPDRPRILWIDAVCINQRDIAEKSTQVATMGEIYANATRVLAWLGPEANNSKRAIELLKWTGRQVEVDDATKKLRPAQGSDDASLADVGEPLPFSGDDTACVIALLSRPWFTRLWVRQELHLARKATVHAGLDSLLWDDFTNAVSCLYSKFRQQTLGSEWSVTRHAYHACDSRKYHLDNLIGRLRTSDCMNPRDRIYGIMSMLHESQEVKIRLDYSASVAEVYEHVILRHIAHHESLVGLRECGGSQSSSIPDLPSWVPDWSGSTHTVLWPISSAADCFPAVTKYLGHGALRVSGVRCGVVTKLSEVRGGPPTSPLVIEDMQRLRTFISLEEQGGTPLGEADVVDALAHALFLGRFRESYRPLHGGWPSLKAAKDWIAGHFASKTPLNSVGTNDFLGSLRPGCVFTTDTGKIGFGPSDVQESDIVALLVGALTPVVLRPTEDGKFLLLGNCYSPGDMFGEPLLGPLPDGVQQVLTSIRSDGSSTDGWVVAFADLATDGITFEDPRLARLGINLEQYREDWGQGRRPLVRLSEADWQRAGVSLERFILV